MREKVVVICPTAQAETRAANWHDGQNQPAAGRASMAANRPAGVTDVT